jgi:hypothetical protein
MPSKTPKQKSFMAAVANNPKFAKKVGVSSKVGKEFEMKDKKMGMKKMADKAGRAMTKKSPDTMGRAMKKYAEGGSVSSRADGIAKKGKTDTKMSKMAMGGIGRNLGGDTSKINMNPTQTNSGAIGQLLRQRGAMGDAGAMGGARRAGAMGGAPRGGYAKGGKTKGC